MGGEGVVDKICRSGPTAGSVDGLEALRDSHYHSATAQGLHEDVAAVEVGVLDLTSLVDLDQLLSLDDNMGWGSCRCNREQGHISAGLGTTERRRRAKRPLQSSC